MTEAFTPGERVALSPYFTNLDGPVFALVNLPEVVKGALFARYSRSAKSLRRLFLDEFLSAGPPGTPAPAVLDTTRADQLYERVFGDYGDDSVAQLGGVHLACEDASNILTKVLEWGRLMAYLEQSTRYIPYADRPDGRYRYHVPTELAGVLRDRYVSTLDDAFATYAAWLPRMIAFYSEKFPRGADEVERVYRLTIRAKALDTLRGLLPAATASNVGIFATAQAYEQLLLRMRAHPLEEVRACADLMLIELRKVIPAFLTRVDRPDRGGLWTDYLARTHEDVRAAAGALLADVQATPRDEVTLTDFDPDGETKVVAAALYAASGLPDDQLVAIARGLSPEERERILAAYVGKRVNRRHRPGRAFERTAYRFDVLTDYGAFRDLQRHRLLTLEWQRLSPRHGFMTPDALGEAGATADWTRVMEASAALHDALVAGGHPEVAPYAIAMAYRVRFYMQMNAREAMHVIELRTAPQGHPAYRRVCQRMHRLIAEVAGHRAIAEAMTFADHSEVALERLAAERAAERRRGGA
jgi:thymidylate synthase ThyX